MPIMTEAISKDDFERAEQGLPPLKKKAKPRPEPEPPKVEKLLTFKDLPWDRFVRLVSVRQNVLKNKDRMRFIGYDVAIEFKYSPESIKTKGSKPLDKILSDEPIKDTFIQDGWFSEGDWLQFCRTFRRKVDLSILQM